MILDEDPLREEIHRELMVLYWESGQRSLGLRQFEICRTALSEELGAPPMAETISLYQQLLSDLSPSSPILNPDRSSDIQRAVTLLSHACLSFAAAQDELQQVLHFVQTLMQNKA
jgi:DNA-binding SARP family transcriptional activator